MTETALTPAPAASAGSGPRTVGHPGGRLPGQRPPGRIWKRTTRTASAYMQKRGSSEQRAHIVCASGQIRSCFSSFWGGTMNFMGSSSIADQAARSPGTGAPSGRPGAATGARRHAARGTLVRRTRGSV
ncbi:MAG: hypothetical protein LAP86_10510, partial [Acidobacteriia bacterium]|nr:hypothetical protein [Terriglobia bacterium]